MSPPLSDKLGGHNSTATSVGATLAVAAVGVLVAAVGLGVAIGMAVGMAVGMELGGTETASADGATVSFAAIDGVIVFRTIDGAPVTFRDGAAERGGAVRRSQTM